MTLMKDIMQSWQDTYTVRRVFGEPVEKEGVTVIPVAMVAGGGGGGGAPAESENDAEGAGGGFGGMARPAGVFVVRADGAEWKPALDITMIAMGGIVLGALIAVVMGKALGRRR
ncbi:MAG TPA: sporulation protein [Coriobacteriia bacterium]